MLTWFVLGIAAAITGFLARKQINETPQQYKGAGLATAGLVLGVISIIAGIVMWILIASGSLRLELLHGDGLSGRLSSAASGPTGCCARP